MYNSIEILLVLFLSIITYIFIVWTVFADFVGILIKLIPIKIPKGYDRIKRMKNSQKYKQHKKRWIKKYLFLIVIYLICFYIVSFIINDLETSFLIAFMILAICFGIVGNIEGKQRRNLEKNNN